MNTLIQVPQKSWSAEQWFTTLQADAGTWQLIPTLSQAQWLGHAQQWQKTAQQYAFSKQLPAALQLGNMIQRVGEQLSADSLIAFAHWTFGNLYIIDQQASQALDHYRQAETLYRQLQDTANLARMNVGMVAALIRADQFSAARAVIEFTFPILEKSADPQDQKRYAGLANNAAVVYRHFADYDAAISLYEKKVVLYEQQPNNPKAQAEIARTLLNLGILKTELNLWEEAEEAFARSQKLFERADLPVQYHHDIERLCFHYASLASQRDPDAPYMAQIFMDAREQIHELDNQLSLAIIEAQWRIKMGVISAEFRQHLTQLRQQLIHTQVHKRNLVQVDLLIASQSEPDAAIPQLETLRTQNDAISDWQLHFDILRRLGEAHQKRTCLHTAQTVFEEAINLLETISQELPSSHLRTGFLDDKLEVYQDLAKLRLHQHDIAGALTWVERGRGRELLHLLAGENPQTEPPQLALDQLIKQIPADTLLLCYFTLRDELWLLPLTKQKILPTYNLGHCITPAQIKSAIGRIHSLTRYPPHLIARHAPRLTATTQQILANWYTHYLFPVATLLADYQQLVIIPADFLHYVPLHASYNTHTDKYLIETHAISYAPSLSAWSAAQAKPTNPAPDTTELTGLALSYGGDNLQHTDLEVAAILAAFPSFKAFCAAQATTTHLTTPTIHTIRYLHIAAHAVFRTDNPRLSYIQFADKQLTTLDVLDLNLQAHLVTLSACETGRGLLRGGEYMGLVWAFLAAGARAVLATHWRVDDYATSYLMQVFYQQLLAGHSQTDALRSAQLALLSAENIQYRHPYYWAPFYLYGMPDHRKRNTAFAPATTTL